LGESDADDDLAPGLTSVNMSQSFAGFFEGVASIDDRLESPCLDELLENEEVVMARDGEEALQIVADGPVRRPEE
jgi:hypothetical protein